MCDDIPDWLPDLILLEECKGNWATYINVVYEYFHKDFVENNPSFEKRPVLVRYHPAYEEKGATFWHLVSEGNQESERIPDLRRCERIRWPRPIIEQSNPLKIKIWETARPWKGQMQRRINLTLSNFSYIVVIAETKKGFDLVTAFFVKEPHRRDKFKREFESYIKQKKEGSAY
jgi:hypothetical protein